MKSLILIPLALILTVSVSAQCLMIPIPFKDHVDHSELIVEGEIIAKTSFETFNKDFIYTSYDVRVTKVFQGQLATEIVKMIEPGGTVGRRSVHVEPSVQLNVGETGTFFLSRYILKHQADNQRFSQTTYRAHGSMQSVFRYDLSTHRATGVFMQHSITDLYKLIEKTSGRRFKEIRPLSVHETSNLRMAPSISSMSPLTITAGTHSVLTINGSGFGDAMGTSTVEFKNANNGGMAWYAATAPHIQAWSNTQIQIRVPTAAGSGQVRVIVSGMTGTSSQSLTIQYAQLNVTFDIDGEDLVFRKNHYNHNGSGGYTFNYHTSFNANNPARESFMRALNSWRCATEVNFRVGNTTTINDDVEDGVNIVRFDVGTELAEGVGAHCVAYTSDCVLLDPNWSNPILELDLVFNDVFPGGLTWEFGPALPSGTEIDFETIAVHELGHAHGLGHVISTPEVMHYTVNPGEHKRPLSANDIAGGNHVHAQSTGNPACFGYAPMTDYKRVRYVDHLASGTKSGDSWTNALTKLQDALLVCADSIYVAKGTYYPDEGVGLANNDQALRFHINSTVVLIGGYPNGGGARNLASNQTILSGDIEQDGLTDADNSQTVVRTSANATLDGFIIQRGYADGSSGEAKDGGGMYNSANCIVRNCIFRFNRAQGNGSNGNGGALYHASGWPIFQNVLAYKNEATQHGSAFYYTQNAPACSNCTITANQIGLSTVYQAGGCLYLNNSILWNNVPNADIVANGAGCIDVSYSMFDDASLPAGAYGDNYLLNTNPEFVNPGADNYAIIPCSPATHSGLNAFNSTTTDLLSAPRFTGNIDRGAQENAGYPTTVVTSAADSGPGTLRQMISDACPGQTITFSSSLNGQTILISGTQFVLSKNVTIHGLGMNNITISGDESRRIFNVNAGITATIRDLNMAECNATNGFGNCIRNFGNLTLQNVKMDSYAGTEHPFTFFNDDGMVTIMNQVIIKE